MFAWFERMVHPYPEAPMATPPKGFGAFLWSCSEGTRGYIAAMTAFTAAIGAFEALLFAMMGRIVDWLAEVAPADLWAREKHTLGLLALALLVSIALAPCNRSSSSRRWPATSRCACAGISIA